jgi:hypothetical protein
MEQINQLINLNCEELTLRNIPMADLPYIMSKFADRYYNDRIISKLKRSKNICRLDETYLEFNLHYLEKQIDYFYNRYCELFDGPVKYPVMKIYSLEWCYWTAYRDICQKRYKLDELYKKIKDNFE